VFLSTSNPPRLNMVIISSSIDLIFNRISAVEYQCRQQGLPFALTFRCLPICFTLDGMTSFMRSLIAFRQDATIKSDADCGHLLTRRNGARAFWQEWNTLLPMTADVANILRGRRGGKEA
jgi:hypothetical protein